MGIYYGIDYKVILVPPPTQKTLTQLLLDSSALKNYGFNIQINVSSPSILSEPPISSEIKSVPVMAHLDTGASITSIDNRLAKHLGLLGIGKTQTYTAGGLCEADTYIADISFPNTALKPFTNMQISSCKLPYTMDFDNPAYLAPENFGVLIGRDVLANWNVNWNGLASIVLISD